MGNSISYGTTNIKYTVKKTERKTLAIEVHPDNSVHVISPMDASAEDIQSKVERKAPWIAKQQRFFEGRPDESKEPEWISGENIFYLGRQYRLKVHEGTPDVKLAGKYLNVTVENKENKTKIAALVNGWYLKHARRKLEERMVLLNPILEREGLKINSLMIRKLKKRWGSCTKKGNIVINSDLIKAPVNCIDYVLIHEICHLKHYNHSKEFWAMLNKYCPNWVKSKNKLESFNF